MKAKGNVFFKDKLSGQIQKKEDGSFVFTYPNSAQQAVSLTLPVKPEGYMAEDLFPFFDGLIPEGWLLNLTQKNWKIPKDDRMSLLLTTCQDCIGAAHVLSAEGSERLRPQAKKAEAMGAKKAAAKHFKSDRCLVCLQGLDNGQDLYHKKCASNLFGFSQAPIIDISLVDLESLALMQINQRLTLTGVQKKLSLSAVKDEKKERLTIVGLDGRFILKPSTDEFPDMAEVEHLSMKLAELQNIPMAKCGLVYLKSGERAYITKRFDRVDGEKIQMEDFCQLSEKPTNKKYSGSSEGLGKIVDKYSNQAPDDKITLFQVLLFSFWIGNSDMHLKNFSLWRDPKNQLIRMSPGYDFLSTRLLIPAKEDPEEMALSINGKKNKIKWSDFLALGDSYKIPRKVVERIRDQMIDTYFDADALIEQSFLIPEKKQQFLDLIQERSRALSF